MTDYWLCDAGVTLRGQVDGRWPHRDKASDGWIGDASHQATVSDHNPCWGCVGDSYGVVRAIDLDTNLSKEDPDAMQRFANQLISLARQGNDGGRLSYVIYNRKIASGTYSSAYWTWRTYTGTADPHTSHSHVSFKAKGDHLGGRFHLPILSEPEHKRRRRRLRRAIENLAARIRSLRVRVEAKRKKISGL